MMRRTAVRGFLIALALLSAARCDRDPLLDAETVKSQFNRPPVALDVLPGSGSLRAQQFRVHFSDPDGGDNLKWAQLLVNRELKGEGGCYVQWEKNGNAFYLLDDAAKHPIGPGLPGTPGTKLENSQCVVTMAGASTTVAGADFILTVPIEFKSTYRGQQELFIRTEDAAGVTLPWKKVATWSLQ
jgi:hypothetical protein